MKRNPARGAFFNTAGREIRREKCKRGNIWRNSGEFIFIAVLHPVVDFESSESIVPASIFAKGSKIGKLTRLQIPNFYFFLQTWQHLESLENCIDGLKFIFCSKWIGYWPISLWKGRSVHFVAEDWTFPEIDREMVPKLSKRVSNTTSLKALDIFQKEIFFSYRYKTLHVIVVHLLSVSRWIGGIFFVRIHLANRLPLRWKVKSLIQF